MPKVVKWFASTTMILQWVLLLTLVTTLIAADKSSYDENRNDLLRWLDNTGRGFGTWRSPPDDEDEELEYPGNLFKNGELILILIYLFPPTNCFSL